MKLSVVVIVSREAVEIARAALQAALDSRAAFPFELIVVDNAAADAEAKLAPFQGRVRLIRNRENVGFARANNQAAAVAAGEYLLFLNSDTRVDPDAFARLVDFADSRPDAGAVGPLVLNPDGSFQLSTGRPISLCSEFHQKMIAAPRARRTDPRRLRTREVGWVSGCCLLVRRADFPGGRVFDEGIFLYFEDSELCARLRKAGRKVFFHPAARIVHHGGASVRSLPLRVAVEYRRSQLHVYRKHLPAWQLSALTLYLSLKYRWKLLRGRGEDERSAARQILELLKK
jgi:hypothetical protein